MQKRVKMVDVARAANVSRTAVSLILNQVPNVRIAEATRQRVLQVARELGYAPGPSLDQIAPDGQRLFGLLINEISSAYPVDLIHGVQNQADSQALQVIIQVTDGLPDRELAALDTFARLGVEGVVYATTFTALVTPPPALNRFRHVLLNCRRADRSGRAILPAERHGGALAAHHLIGLGRRRLAAITGDPWQFASIERQAGFRRTLGAAGLIPIAEVSGDWSHAGGYAAASALLQRADRPDALFCHNDIMARGALAAARDLGLAVPQAIAIIGYDDREFAADLDISTITLPFGAMAERAMADLAGKTDLPSGTLAVQGELIARASTMAMPAS